MAIMTTEEIRRAVGDYRRDGYAVLPNAVPARSLDSAEEVIDGREGLREQELQGLPGGRSWISQAGQITFTAKLAGKEPILREVLAAPTLRQFVAAVLGPRPRLYFDQAVYKKPGCEQIVPWHQDNGYNPKDPADYVTFWIPLTSTTVENGTIRFQPGRQYEGPLRHWRTSGGYLVCEDGAEGGVPVDLGRGDVVAFSSLLPHSTGPNWTQRVRKAYIASCIVDGTQLVDGTVCNHPTEQPLLFDLATGES